MAVGVVQASVAASSGWTAGWIVTTTLASVSVLRKWCTPEASPSRRVGESRPPTCRRSGWRATATASASALWIGLSWAIEACKLVVCLAQPTSDGLCWPDAWWAGSSALLRQRRLAQGGPAGAAGLGTGNVRDVCPSCSSAFRSLCTLHARNPRGSSPSTPLASFSLRRRRRSDFQPLGGRVGSIQSTLIDALNKPDDDFYSARPILSYTLLLLVTMNDKQNTLPSQQVFSWQPTYRNTQKFFKISLKRNTSWAFWLLYVAGQEYASSILLPTQQPTRNAF